MRTTQRPEAPEHVAAELEKLRILRDHEPGVRVEEGSLLVRPTEV